MVDNLRTVFVVNPVGAGRRLGKDWPRVADVLRKEYGDFEEALTTGPLEAIRLTREALKGGAEMIVAVGGDGTMNEVANGFFDGDEPVRPDAVLGLLPYGTGGDFRKTFDLSRDVEDNARKLRGRESRPLDVGRAMVTGPDGGPVSRYFVNIASFGMSGEVVAMVNESSKLLGGGVTFWWCTVKGLFVYKNCPVLLTHDKGEPQEHKANTVAVCNGRFFGGGMHIGPMAKPDDGKLEVVVIGDVGLVDLALHQGKLYKGQLDDFPKIAHQTATRLTAEPKGSRPVHVEVEGEPIGVLPATFEILPGAMRIHA